MSPKAYISPGVLLCRADRGRMWKKGGGSVGIGGGSDSGVS